MMNLLPTRNRTKLLCLIGIMLQLIAACTAHSNPKGNSLVVVSVKGLLYSQSIYSVDINGNETDINMPISSINQIVWTKNRQWVVFTTGFANKSEIYYMSSNGDYRTRLTDYRNGESFDPTWSHQDDKLAYFSFDKNGNQDGIYLINMSCLLDKNKCDSSPKFLVRGYSPSWSPSGEKIVYETTDHQIAILSVNQTTNPSIVLDNKNCHNPKWSPKDERILLSCFTENTFDVISVGVDGQNFINLTHGLGNNSMPVWSPDGAKIAFVSDRDTNGTMLGFDDTVRSNSVYIMDVNGSTIQRITTRENEHILWMTWIDP